jgi:ArsR family transcriptional regulator
MIAERPGQRKESRAGWLYIDKYRYMAIVSNMRQRCAHSPTVRKRRQASSGETAPTAVAASSRLVAVFKALSDPTRLEIVERLHRAGGSLCACEIESWFSLAQPTVSHHLRLLRQAGLLDATRRGTWIHYALAPDGLAAARTLLHRLSAAAAHGAPSEQPQAGM